MKKILIPFLIILTFCFSGFAQTNKNGPWTLEECINYAIDNNIQVKRTQLDLEQSNANLQQSRAALLPSLNAFGSHRYAFGRTVDPVEYRFVEETVQSNEFGISSELLIFGGFQNQNAISQNKILAEANMASLEQARNDVSISVAGAFLEVVQNKELLNTAQFQFNTTTEQAKRTEKLVQAGSLPQASYLEIVAQNATDELAVVNAENQLDLTKLRLMQFLQIPYDQSFDVVEPELQDIEGIEQGLDANQIYDLALTTQPIMKSMDLRFRSALLEERIAKGGNYPNLVAFGNANSFYSSRAVDPLTRTDLSFSDQIENNFGQSIGVRLNVPIFNNWRVKTDIQRARILKKSAELNQWETQNNLRQEVEQAYLNVRTAAKTYSSVQGQVEALEEAFRVTEQRFNLGAANAVDYNVSKNNLNKAQSDLIRAKYDYVFRTKILDFYQGKTLSLD